MNPSESSFRAKLQVHWKRREFVEWRQVLASLCVFPSKDLPQPKTVIIDTLKGYDAQKLQGLKHGVVFTPNAVLELLELSKS
jgi:hypothetical protein